MLRKLKRRAAREKVEKMKAVGNDIEQKVHGSEEHSLNKLQ